MTRLEFLEKIKRKLGYPTVKVELTSASLTDCVNDSLYVARKYGYGSALNKRFYVLQLSAGVSTYPLPADVNTIESYLFPSMDGYGGVNTLFTWQNMFFGGPWSWAAGDFGDLVTYNNFLSYMETWKKYAPNKFRLLLDQPQARVFCQPTPLSSDFLTSGTDLVVLTIWTTFDETIVFDNIEVQKLATGYAKKALALIRGKYTGYALPGAQGGSLNADQLASEGDKEIEEALEVLKNEGDGLEFVLA